MRGRINPANDRFKYFKRGMSSDILRVLYPKRKKPKGETKSQMVKSEIASALREHHGYWERHDYREYLRLKDVRAIRTAVQKISKHLINIPDGIFDAALKKLNQNANSNQWGDSRRRSPKDAKRDDLVGAIFTLELVMDILNEGYSKGQGGGAPTKHALGITLTNILSSIVEHTERSMWIGDITQKRIDLSFMDDLVVFCHKVLSMAGFTNKAIGSPPPDLEDDLFFVWKKRDGKRFYRRIRDLSSTIWRAHNPP